MPQLTHPKSTLLLVLLFINCHSIFAQKKNPNTILLPLTFKEGNGIFSTGRSGLQFDDDNPKNPWFKTQDEITGIPPGWKDVKKTIIHLYMRQFVYQNYKTGKISDKWYEQLQESWGWLPDTTEFTKTPIKCYVNVIRGIDESGIEKLMIDTNNNLDFSDETFLIPEEQIRIPNEVSKNLRYVNTEIYNNNKVEQRKIPLLITLSRGDFWYEYPQHATTSITTYVNNKQKSIDLAVYVDPNYKRLAVVVPSDSVFRQRILPPVPKMGNSTLSPEYLKNYKIDTDLAAQKNEFIKIGDEVYKIKGITRSNQLELERLPANKPLTSSQINFPAIPIKGVEFTSKKPISSADHKGKYLLVKFWGTWCGPCVGEIPNLKELYEKVDKNKIEFLGIPSNDNPATLEKFLVKTPLPWPQILSNKDNPIANSYNIRSYPSSVLIDPDGIIIAKNLHTQQLHYTLANLDIIPPIEPFSVGLELKFEEGYGPFRSPVNGLNFKADSDKNEWSETDLPITGVPTQWKNVKRAKITFDLYQSVYQDYLAKKISNEFFEELKESWSWQPNVRELSKNQIRCFVYLIKGEDETGTERILVDTNNNLDFSDEQPITIQDQASDIANFSKNRVLVSYQLYNYGNKIDRKIPVVISKVADYFVYETPEFAITTIPIDLQQGKKLAKLAIMPDPSFKRLGALVLNDSLPAQQIDPAHVAQKNEFLKLGPNVYLIQGIRHNVLELQRMATGTSVFSTQMQFPAIPIDGAEFTSKKHISSTDYKGKYLFVEFWGTWCGPCVGEIPRLKELYSKLDKSKIEFLGIASNDKPVTLEKFLTKTPIPWPQLLSNPENPIANNYKIERFPSSILIDTNGIIIAKDLHANELEERLSELLK